MAEVETSGKHNVSDPIYRIGIDASVRGLEALKTSFTNMPPKSGVAFVVIQPLSPMRRRCY